ncbi:hypothetical protein REPUB_Repub18cG0057300 [Reevesia pubescens]
MPLKFYDSAILRRMGDEIGKSMRIDWTTSHMLIGKFARMCVELDLTKPMVLEICIGGLWQRVENEGLRMLCFHYGSLGILISEFENECFGSWMITKKKNRRSAMAKQDSNGKQIKNKRVSKGNNVEATTSGSRFVVLVEDGEQLDDIEVVPSSLEPTRVGGDTFGIVRVKTISDNETLKEICTNGYYDFK